jgi:FtsH-binding integral membrane protein
VIEQPTRVLALTMDKDKTPISGHLKIVAFWAMGIFSLLAIGMLGTFSYALLAHRLSPVLAIEVGLPFVIGSAVVLYLIAFFHRKLQSISRFRLTVLIVAVFALVAALTSALLSVFLAHVSRQVVLTLRLIALVSSIWLVRFIVKQRKQ